MFNWEKLIMDKLAELEKQGRLTREVRLLADPLLKFANDEHKRISRNIATQIRYIKKYGPLKWEEKWVEHQKKQEAKRKTI